MGNIAVAVTRAVEIDRDGARELLKDFTAWANRESLQGTGYAIKYDDVDTFLARYADAGSAEESQ